MQALFTCIRYDLWVLFVYHFRDAGFTYMHKVNTVWFL